MLFIYLFFFTLNSVVARSNHTYYMTCCLPGVQSGKAITPMASKYPEDLQHLGYLHYMTRVLYLQKRTAVLTANSSCVAALALMGQHRSEQFSFTATSARLKAANMHRNCSRALVLLWLQRCTTFFLVFATKLNLHTFVFFIDYENPNKNKFIKKKQLLQAERKKMK